MGANLNPFYRFGNKGSELLTNIPKVIIIKETVKIQHEADLSWSLYTFLQGREATTKAHIIASQMSTWSFNLLRLTIDVWA